MRIKARYGIYEIVQGLWIGYYYAYVRVPRCSQSRLNYLCLLIDVRNS